MQIYSTLSETKVAFAECAVRSLKRTLYLYMEDYGYKYIHKMSHFVTTVKTRENFSDGLDTIKRQGFRLFVRSPKQATKAI